MLELSDTLGKTVKLYSVDYYFTLLHSSRLISALIVEYRGLIHISTLPPGPALPPAMKGKALPES